MSEWWPVRAPGFTVQPLNTCALYRNLNYRRIYASLGLNELRPRKIMDWQARAIF